MDNFLSQVPNEGAQLVKKVASDTVAGLGKVAGDTVRQSYEAVIPGGNNPFAQAAQNREAGKPDQEMQNKKIKERQEALRGIRRVRESLEALQKQTLAKKQREAQVQQQAAQQQKAETEQKKQQSWRDILMRDAKQRGGTGENKNAGM